MTQTVTLQDATVIDLKTALAAVPAPVPTPTPTPAPTPAPPTGNTVVLQTGSDGPNAILVYDSGPTKATWLTLRCYNKGAPGASYAGAFVSFQTMNYAGTWMESVLLNGGLVDGTVGKEQGDFDVIFKVDGTYANISMCGRYAGQPPGLLCWPSNLLFIGGPLNRFAEMWLQEYPARPGMPAGVTRCVKVNGGYVPIYS